MQIITDWRTSDLTRVWRADMEDARAAFAVGDQAWGHRCLRRASIARRWLIDDLRAIRKARNAAALHEARIAEVKKIKRRMFTAAARHDARMLPLRRRLTELTEPRFLSV